MDRLVNRGFRGGGGEPEYRRFDRNILRNIAFLKFTMERSKENIAASTFASIVVC